MAPCPSSRSISAFARGLVGAALALALSACAHTHGGTKDAPEERDTKRLSLKDTPVAAPSHRQSVAPAKSAPVKKVIRTVRTEPAPRLQVSSPTAPARKQVAAPKSMAPAPAATTTPAAGTPAPAPKQAAAPKAITPAPAPSAAPSAAIPQPPAPTPAEAEVAVCGTRADCLKAFRAMVADPDQSWMAKTPTPQEYATGMRLFAYRALAKKLECRKLVQAVEEITMAEAMLAAYRNGVHAEQARRVGALNAVVKRELTAELKARC